MSFDSCTYFYFYFFYFQDLIGAVDSKPVKVFFMPNVVLTGYCQVKEQTVSILYAACATVDTVSTSAGLCLDRGFM